MYAYIKLRTNNTIIEQFIVSNTAITDNSLVSVDPRIIPGINDITNLVGKCRYINGVIVPMTRVLTKLSFIKLLTPSEYEEILVKAKTVFKVEKFKQTFDYAQDIDLDDQMVIDMLMGLIGEISGFDSTRINKILEG